MPPSLSNKIVCFGASFQSYTLIVSPTIQLWLPWMALMLCHLAVLRLHIHNREIF